MHSRTLIQRSDRQVSCPLRDEAAILNMATGVYYGLDAVGAVIWQRIERPISFGEVNAALLSEYDVPPASAEQDLDRFLHELVAAGLVEIKDEPAEAIPPSSGT
jgi:hypothetical protein